MPGPAGSALHQLTSWILKTLCDGSYLIPVPQMGKLSHKASKCQGWGQGWDSYPDSLASNCLPSSLCYTVSAVGKTEIMEQKYVRSFESGGRIQKTFNLGHFLLTSKLFATYLVCRLLVADDSCFQCLTESYSITLSLFSGIFEDLSNSNQAW